MADLLHGNSRLLTQGPKTCRRLERASIQDAQEMVDGLADGEELVIVSKGQVSVLDLVLALRARLGGPCEIDVASWRVGTDDAAVLGELLGSGDATRVRLLIGFASVSTEAHRIRLYEEWVGRGNVRLARSHLKVAVIRAADGRGYVVRGTANFNTNQRLEWHEISPDPLMVDFASELFDDAFGCSPTPAEYSYPAVRQGLEAMMGGSELVAEVRGYHRETEAALASATPDLSIFEERLDSAADALGPAALDLASLWGVDG